MSSLHRVQKPILRKLDTLLDNHCWLSPLSTIDTLMHPVDMQLSDRVYQIFGEFLAFRLVQAAEASQEFCDEIINAPGMAFQCREVAIKKMQPWLDELMGKFNQSMELSDEGQLVKDYFDSFGFVRMPDPTPEEIQRQKELLEWALKGL